MLFLILPLQIKFKKKANSPQPEINEKPVKGELSDTLNRYSRKPGKERLGIRHNAKSQAESGETRGLFYIDY